jgi:hypothetical protein
LQGVEPLCLVFVHLFGRCFPILPRYKDERGDLDGHDEDAQHPEQATQPPLPGDPSSCFLFAQAKQKFHGVLPVP